MSIKRVLLAMICIMAMLFCLVACDASQEEIEVVEEVEVVETVTVPKIMITTAKRINKNSYVDCTIAVIDGDGNECILDEEASVKIRGNSTAAADKKPYNIKFSSKTDVLGMGENKKWCLLANCFDKTLMRNMSVFDFAATINVPFTPDYRVVDVYVNEELMGSFLITDAIEVSKTRVDIDLEENDFLLELDYNPEDKDCQYFRSYKYDIKFAINEPEKKELTKEQFTYVTDFVTAAELALASGDFEKVSAYFDVESMVNFYITAELFKNVDVNTSSTRFHVKDGKVYGGPVWDFDLSSGNLERNYYVGYYSNSENENGSGGIRAQKMPWFGALMGYEEFRELVFARYLELQPLIVNLYEDNELGMNRIDYYSVVYKDSFEMNNVDAGWAVDKVYNKKQLEITPFATYKEHIEYYRQWLKDRNAWLLAEWNLVS